MQFTIETAERRVKISHVGKSECYWEVMKVKSSTRRYSYRSLLPSVLIAGVLLPFLFIRIAFLTLDSPSISCFGLRIGPLPLFYEARDTSQEIMKALKRAAAAGEFIDPKVVEAAPDSLPGLLAEMTAAAASHQHLDITTFVLKTKAMLMKMDQKVELARRRVSIYRHFASIGIPKSMNCLALRLAEEYLVNAAARSSLPLPEYFSHLTNPSYLHIVLLTDNILAAAVVVSSTITNSADPGKLVFHILTDKKTYTAMHTWFCLNPVSLAIVEVKGLHQFDWPPHMNATIMRTVEEIHRGLLAHRNYRAQDEEYRRLEGLNPSSFSLLNHLKIHLPELFPKLKRVIFLDDDVVVQRDLIPLSDLDLNGNVNGAVGIRMSRDGHCTARKLDDYLNFSHPSIPSLSFGLEKDRCTWVGGMNIFDLEAWRRTSITQVYQQLLKMNRESGFVLFRLGWLPPALIAFDGQVYPINSSWHLSGLGQQIPKPEALESAAVLHFSGRRKPWLEIGFPELRETWRTYLNRSDQFLRICRVVG